jgi:hypothetical protein
LAENIPSEVYDPGLPVSLQNPLNLLQGSQWFWDVLKGRGANDQIKAFIREGHVYNTPLSELDINSGLLGLLA